jgi:hypothetical protein
MEKMDWTHKDVTITDIRKISNLYIISIDDKKVTPPMLVNEKIFNERLKLYFLKEAHRVTREEILGVKWNMYITKGYYIKVYAEDDVKKFDMDENKFYVSYLEVAGPLATFQSVYKPPKETEVKK